MVYAVNSIEVWMHMTEWLSFGSVEYCENKSPVYITFIKDLGIGKNTKCHVMLLYSITLLWNELLVNVREEWEYEKVWQLFSFHEFMQSKIKGTRFYYLYMKMRTLVLNLRLWLDTADCFALPPFSQSSSIFFSCRCYKTKNCIFNTSL